MTRARPRCTADCLDERVALAAAVEAVETSGPSGRLSPRSAATLSAVDQEIALLRRPACRCKRSIVVSPCDRWPSAAGAFLAPHSDGLDLASKPLLSTTPAGQHSIHSARASGEPSFLAWIQLARSTSPRRPHHRGRAAGSPFCSCSPSLATALRYAWLVLLHCCTALFPPPAVALSILSRRRRRQDARSVLHRRALRGRLLCRCLLAHVRPLYSLSNCA